MIPKVHDLKTDPEACEELSTFIMENTKTKIEEAYIDTCSRQGDVLDKLELSDGRLEFVIYVCPEGHQTVQTERGKGRTIFYNGQRENMQCTRKHKRALACRTCDRVEDPADCHFRICEKDGVCFSETVKGRNEDTLYFTRGCRKRSQCNQLMWYDEGGCRDPETVEGSVCVQCSNYPEHRYARCVEDQKALDVTKDCLRNWKEENTPAGSKAHCGEILAVHSNYDLEGCKQLACSLGGNVITFRKGPIKDDCAVRECREDSVEAKPAHDHTDWKILRFL